MAGTPEGFLAPEPRDYDHLGTERIEDHESQRLRELQDADAEASSQAYAAARAMRAADLPRHIGLITGPRGKDLVALRSMYDTLGTMLVGPKEEYDWQQTRRHLRILISRWEMDSTRETAPAVNADDV